MRPEHVVIASANSQMCDIILLTNKELFYIFYANFILIKL